jgi:2-pyrone-4,6-dicarboxylate lactonase
MKKTANRNRSRTAVPTCPPPNPYPLKPAFVPPPRSIDAHCHIFGPSALFPYVANRTYTPHDAPLDTFRRLQRHLGFSRAVIVQPACYGHDHKALLDALKRGGGKYRGVALLSPEIDAEDIQNLDNAGICGARINVLPHLGKKIGVDGIETIAALIKPYGWHLSVHVAGGAIIELSEVLRRLDLPVVIDHIARVNVQEGIEGRAFKTLLRLLDTGNVWVKLSGTDRISMTPAPFADAIRLARHVAKHAPQRIVWGTDWPHPNITNTMPNDGQLVDLIPEIANSDVVQRLMLIDNPERLFKFKS